MPLTVIDHPLAQHYLTHLRDKTTTPALFRTLTRKMATLLAIEASRDFPHATVPVETPLEMTVGEVLAGELVVVPILRAGLGMLDGVVDLFPEVSVGYIGLERDETTAVANSYYRKLPGLKDRVVWLVDPMLATGGSAEQAVEWIYGQEPASVALLCVVAAPEGAQRLEAAYPSLRVYTAALDRGLNDRKYITPGLGDFGDRLYGTF